MGIITVTVQASINRTVRISDKLADRNGSEQSLWIVRALFCATRFVNDTRYCVGGRTSVED